MENKKTCYESSKGIVHVYDHGSRTCRCGEKVAENKIPAYGRGRCKRLKKV